MGTVPKRHPCAALFNGEPMSHYATAGRPAHAVEPSDKEVEHPHEDDGGHLMLCADELHWHNHEEHRDGCEEQA